jgi:hypothetical protein
MKIQITILPLCDEIDIGTKKVSILMPTFFNTLAYIRTNQPPCKLL